MAALFPRWATLAGRLALLGLLGGAVAVPLVLIGWSRTSWATGEGHAPDQPMWFDHQHHVQSYRIDCRYCHAAVERSATAGMPATELCVPCHTPVWMNGPAFEPVRRSLETGRPIPWRRVNRLADFVYFDHSIHTATGVGCETCHGRVDRMRLVAQATPLTMSWCLECHREPERYLRPVEEATTMGWRPDRPQLEVGRELVRKYGVGQATTCTACHR